MEEPGPQAQDVPAPNPLYPQCKQENRPNNKQQDHLAPPTHAPAPQQHENSK